MEKRIIEAIAGGIISILLFKLGVNAAYAERGYKAVGGEYCILLLPIIYCSVKQSIKDTAAILKKTYNRERDEES